jgi:hypothetical protein
MTDDFVVESGEYTLAPGEERFFCYPYTVAEDVTLRSFHSDATTGIHHLLYVQTTQPEPTEPFECDVLIKRTWLPLFAKATGSVTLDLPPEAGILLPKGAQMLMQLHLLNASSEPLTGKARITSQKIAPSEVKYHSGLFAFGTQTINLPPHTAKTLTNDCVVSHDVDIFAVYPHEHQFGTHIKFEAGKSPSELQPIWDKAWDFDNQGIYPYELHLNRGDFTRTTCEYNNTSDNTVKYGESTKTEMCFFLTFSKDGKRLDGCIDLSANPELLDGGDPTVNGADASTCHDIVANEKGIGQPCLRGANECKLGLTCSSDVQSSAPPDGLCISVGECMHPNECGSNATCCAPAAGGGAVNICVPEACRPSDCPIVP